jgi:hypothetical protein
MKRTFLTVLAAALCATLLLAAAPARAADAIQTNLYFGLTDEDGTTISEEAWRTFVFEEVTPRFPDGLTVIDAYGQSNPPASVAAMEGRYTKILILVHPDTDAAAKAVAEVKAAFMIRFERDSVFHTDMPVRVVE